MNKPQGKAVPSKASPKKMTASEPFHFQGRRFHVVFALTVIVVSFMLYGNGISNGYSLDDEFVMHNDTIVQKGIKGIPKLFRSRYGWDQKGSYGYRPVVKATFALQTQIFGKSVHAGHVVNILLYAILCIFIFYFLRKLFYEQVSDFFLFIMLAIFISHPLHTEVVDSLKNRDEMLSFLFGFFCSYAFIKGFDAETAGKKVLWIVAGCISFGLGVLSKPDSLVFLAITPLILYFFKTREWKNALLAAIISFAFCWFIAFAVSVSHHFSWKILIAIPFMGGAWLLYRSNFEKWKKAAASVLFIITAMVIFLLIAKRILPHTGYHRTYIFIEEPLMGTHWYQRIALGFSCLWFYIRKLVFPLNMICYYGYDEFHPFPSWFSIDVIMGILTAVGLLYIAYKNNKDRGVLMFSLLYFGGTLFTFLDILQVGPGIVAERFMFIPSVGFALLVSLLIFHIFKLSLKYKPTGNNVFLLYAVTGIIGLVYSIRTIARNPDWKSHLSIYEHDGKIATRSAKLQSLLGSTATQMVNENPNLPPEEKEKYRRIGEAAYLASISIYPEYATSLNNLGMIQYNYYKDNNKAIEYFRKATKSDTNYTEAYFNLGATYDVINKEDSSEYYFLRAIKSNQEYYAAYVYLSRLYFKEGKMDKVIQLNRNALDNGHISDAVYVNLGNVYLIEKDTLKAVDYFQKAVAFNKNDYSLCDFLTRYYTLKGELDKAQYYSSIGEKGKEMNNQASQQEQ